jgi:hypothetical protein
MSTQLCQRRDEHGGDAEHRKEACPDRLGRQEIHPRKQVNHPQTRTSHPQKRRSPSKRTRRHLHVNAVSESSQELVVVDVTRVLRDLPVMSICRIYVRNGRVDGESIRDDSRCRWRRRPRALKCRQILKRGNSRGDANRLCRRRRREGWPVASACCIVAGRERKTRGGLERKSFIMSRRALHALGSPHGQRRSPATKRYPPSGSAA